MEEMFSGSASADLCCCGIISWKPSHELQSVTFIISYFNFLFVNIMENHINQISKHIFLYLVGINSTQKRNLRFTLFALSDRYFVKWDPWLSGPLNCCILSSSCLWAYTSNGLTCSVYLSLKEKAKHSN